MAGAGQDTRAGTPAEAVALIGAGPASLTVARDLGYRPNLNASRLARGDFSTFGLLVSDLHNPIMADIVDGFVLTDTDAGYETHLASGFNSAERERAMAGSPPSCAICSSFITTACPASW